LETYYDILVDELKNKNLRLSAHRLKILQYLCENLNHPTADQIYVHLLKEVPTLSKTTVYNTLHVLHEAGLVRVINIEDNETRYDIIIESHGHFKCEKCGSIFNFKVDFDVLETNDLAGFKVKDKDVYFKGFCNECLLNIESEN